MKTELILLGDYSADQAGYDQAKVDNAVHVVSIDEQSYTSMYNVQQSIQATCECLGQSVSMGLVRDGKYLSMHIVEVGNNDDDYQDLDDAFELGLKHQLEILRDAVDDSLDNLMNALSEGEERKTIDHCIDCVSENRRSGSPISSSHP